MDLYANSAKIQMTSKFADGRVEERQLSGAALKEIILLQQGLLANRGDISDYSNVELTPEGDGLVRIRVDRYSRLNKYTSPLSILAQRQEGGHWLIVEEHAEYHH